MWHFCIISEVVTKYRSKIAALEEDIARIEKEELQDKDLRIQELKIHKAEKIIENYDEIMSRPKRTWFQTNQEREREKGI